MAALAERDGLAGLAVPGAGLHALATRLYPICRSITGAGVRETLTVLRRHVPLEINEVASGTPVLDWTVPSEWTLREAYIADGRGTRIVDAARHALHVVSYSTPVRARMTLAELRPHLHTLPAQPDLIPYRTSYYVPAWGFCLPHRALEAMREESYEVVIDASLAPGALVWGEHLHQGELDEEVLLSTHICHPSLANDNCSGMAVLALLAEAMAGLRTRLSYRFLFIPGTIGAIAWLARNRDAPRRIRHGLVISNVGDGGGPAYKRSRRGDAVIDRAAAHVLGHWGAGAKVLDFSPYGYDERQYCSPGFDLPVGAIQRSAWGTYPEYHTSADDLAFIRPEHLETSLRLICSILDTVDGNATLRNTMPFGEPQLGRRGLYGAADGVRPDVDERMACLWVLNQADGTRDLLAIAERSGLTFAVIRRAARRLRTAGLLAAVT
jgi:aminopeptidase-like protein